MTPPLDELLALFEGDRATAMYDEVVTEREHALQAAQLAEAAGAPDVTVAAALLHDVGRLLIEADPAFVAADRGHDKVGERHLRQWFGPGVTAPVGLHVAAKRYLCAVEADYLERLSAVSVRSLAVQGGPMSENEVVAFRARAGLGGCGPAAAVGRRGQAGGPPDQDGGGLPAVAGRSGRDAETLVRPPHDDLSPCRGRRTGDQSRLARSRTLSMASSTLSLTVSTASLSASAGLVDLAFGLQVVVVGQRAGCFLGATLGFVHLACHVGLLVGGEHMTYPGSGDLEAGAQRSALRHQADRWAAAAR